MSEKAGANVITGLNIIDSTATMPKLTAQKPPVTSNNESETRVSPQTNATLTLAPKLSPPNKKAKIEGTKTLIKGTSLIPASSFLPSLNLFATKAIASSSSSSPGTFLNFTIANGELRPSNGPTVSIRDKRADSQKPIIVTVSGLPGSSGIPAGTHQVQIACSEGAEKSATMTTTLSSTNAASILSALSSALPIANVGNSENKTIPIVVATGPAVKGNPTQTGARIISVPVVSAKVVATTSTTYKKIEPKPAPVPISIQNPILTKPSIMTVATTLATPVAASLTNVTPPSVPTPVVQDEKVEKVTTTNGDDKSDPNSKDYDPIQAMDWQDGIATLPGSNLKFKMNEFGTLELAMDETECEEMKESKSEPIVENRQAEELSPPPPVEHHQPTPKESSNPTRKRKAGKITPVFDGKSGNDIQNCLNCGGMGIREEFYQGSDFCSHECLVVCSRKMEMRKKRKDRMLKKKKSDHHKVANLEYDNPSSPCSSEESLRLNNVEDNDPPAVSSTVTKATKFSLGFNWKEYLEETKAIAAPSELFHDFQDIPYFKNLFKVNMKLEGIDPKHPSLFCVLTVVEVVGFRLRLHFDGYSDCFDFWINADSSEIFPAGWCEKTGHKLQPPKDVSGHPVKMFNWNNYLKASKAIAAPKSCFCRIPPNETSANFQTGMKLEAVDKKNSSLVCVATIMDTMANKFLVHFDGWDDMYDYWADPGSPYIHPINWCRDMGHVLTPPNNYKHSNNFNWEQYLIETKSTAVSPDCFREREAHEFKYGMKVEVVDKRNPVLIRVATIVDTQPHAVKIHFDGWDEVYDYWMDDDSSDLHPPFWCQNARYPLQPPYKDGVKNDQTGCPTTGCFGIGHLKGPKYTSHHSAFGCPYSPPNMSKENAMGDRLGSGRSGEAVFIEPLVKKSEAAANAIQQQEATKIPDNQARFRRCPTPGCSGMGHVTGKFTVHHRVSGCPMAARKEKANQESQKTNGSTSPSTNYSIKSENKVNLVLPPPMQLSNHYTSKRGRKKYKTMNNHQSAKNSQGKNVMIKEESDSHVDVVQDKVHHSIFTSTSVFHPVPDTDETSVCWNQHSLLLPGITQMPGFNVTKWNANEVTSFIAGLTGSNDISKIFNEEQIDGDALMLLTQTDLTKIMSIKLGPALKIFNSILMFRKRLEAI